MSERKQHTVFFSLQKTIFRISPQSVDLNGKEYQGKMSLEIMNKQCVLRENYLKMKQNKTEHHNKETENKQTNIIHLKHLWPTCKNKEGYGK